MGHDVCLRWGGWSRLVPGQGCSGTGGREDIPEHGLGPPMHDLTGLTITWKVGLASLFFIGEETEV